jgi:endo-1,4-beta-xylanase
MSVSLELADNNYMTAHALVTFADGSAITVPLERLDYSPPSITVNLSPSTIVSQGNKLIAIHVSFTIKDDYDRLPEIRLESITANEPLDADDIRDASIGLDDRYIKVRATSKNTAGRIYTLTYSATDASGNQTMASANVTVTTTPLPVTRQHQ